MINDKRLELIAHLVAKPGKEEALAHAMLEIVPEVEQEPGCIAYVPHVSREHPGKIVMYEIWADEAAHAAHVQGPSIARLRARFEELLAEPLRTEWLSRLG
jgi:quinol monooxygenase YgiN